MSVLFVGLSLFLVFFFFNDTATTEIYTLSLHDALPIFVPRPGADATGRVDHSMPGDVVGAVGKCIAHPPCSDLLVRPPVHTPGRGDQTADRPVGHDLAGRDDPHDLVNARVETAPALRRFLPRLAHWGGSSSQFS